MKNPFQNKNRTSGMSIIESTVVVAALGVVVAITLPMLNNVRESAKVGKLSSETTTLNTAVKSFVSSGGEIKPDDTALEVLDILKAAMSAGEKAGHVGYTGAFVDPRLTGKLIDKDTKGSRVVWNFDEKRFNITTDLVDGIEAFEMDENAVKPANSRKSYSIFKYATDDKEWIWDYGVAAPKVVISPTPVTTVSQYEELPDPIRISLTPPVQDTPPDPDFAPDPADPSRLSPPVFSIGGGSLALKNYKLPLTISNPNSGTESAIVYRINNSWRMYEEGQVIPILPDTEIDAYVHSFEPWNHASSTFAASSYRSEPVQLDLAVNADSTSVGYYDLVNGGLYVRWSIANLEAYPDYLKTNGFFTTYWSNDSSDPSFPAGRIRGEEYTANYSGESIKLSPGMWGNHAEMALTVFAESRDTTWIHHSEKPSVTIRARKDTLPPPAISLEEIEGGRFRVTLASSSEMPPGAGIYYNSNGETMSFDVASGNIVKGTKYVSPFIWTPEIIQSNGNGNGASGSVNIDRGNGDIPIQQLVLKTNGNLVTQSQSVAFDPLEHPGADTMRGATVNDNSNAEITLESITINDNGNMIVANQVNVLDLKVKNLNFPTNHNLDRITAFENGVELGNANSPDFGAHIERTLKSRNLRDYVKYDGNNNFLNGTPYDFDVTFAPLRNNDYLVVMERFGNSTFDLEALNAAGQVINGSNKVVIREYSWNTGFAPSDVGNQPMFFAVIDIEQFGVNTDTNSITGFRVNNDGGADFKFFTISDNSFENRPVNYEGGLTAGAFPPANLTAWFSPSTGVSTSVSGQIEDPNPDPDPDSTGGSGHSNNGHGNNVDGVDSSNPGQGGGGPNGEVDPSGNVDDEAGMGNSGTGSSTTGGTTTGGTTTGGTTTGSTTTGSTTTGSTTTGSSTSGNNGNGNGNSGTGNSNNGHGNNADGVDSSNPGQGGGGPNGAVDPSGTVDDENVPGNGNSSSSNGKGKGKG